MDNSKLALKLRSDNLSFFEIIGLTYMTIFTNIIYLLPVIAIYLAITTYDIKNYYIYLIIVYILTVKILDYIIFKRRQKKIVPIIISAVVTGFMLIFIRGLTIFFIYFNYAILIRDANFKQASLVLKKILFSNFFKILFTTLFHSMIHIVIFSIGFMFFISNTDIVLKRELIRELTFKYINYFSIVIHLSLAVNSYIIYNYAERKEIIKGE